MRHNLYKQAKILTKLQPHQEAALKRALVNDLVLAHSTGSGKTLTAIAIADALGKPTTVFTPASLVENFKKEIQKHKKGGPKIDVVSLPTAVSRDYKMPAGNTMIIDEAHSLRNAGTARQKYIKDQRANAGRVVALTGTPAYNQVTDWGPLVNIVSGELLVPSDPTEFKKRYIKQTIIDPGWYARTVHGVKPGVHEELQRGAELRDKLSKYIDVFDAELEKPERIDQIIEVPMHPEQEAMYRYINKSLPSSIRYKVQHNMPPSKSEAGMMNAFLNDVRQVSNTPEQYQEGAETGAKITEAVRLLRQQMETDPRFKALVYSNYLDSGINAYAKQLDKLQIPYNIFNGSLTQAKKKKVVDAFNDGSVPIILGSGSASEGLDLKGTKLIQILEPHFNNAKIDQVIGRGIRYKSHIHLPPEERKVVVQRLMSILDSGSSWFGRDASKNTAVDAYLDARAKEKDELIRQLLSALTGKR